VAQFLPGEMQAMRLNLIFVPLGGLLIASDVPQRFDWSTADLSYIGEYAKEYESSRALCAKLINAEPPAADHPTPAEARALKDCDSEALYYGIGMPADPVKARKCAILEDQREPYGGPSQPYYGRAMLAIIYANGIGARQDYDVAVHMACALDNAPGEVGPRLDRLAKLRTARVTKPSFDTCLDTSSGALGGMCAAHDYLLHDKARRQKMAHIGGAWTKAQHALFEQVYRSAEDYAYTLHEMDCFRGTAQSACTTGGADQFMDDFTKRLVALSRGEAVRLEARADAERKRIAREAAKYGKENTADLGDEKVWYDQNERETAEGRVIFERQLVAFAKAAFPTVSSHRIRRIFADM